MTRTQHTQTHTPLVSTGNRSSWSAGPSIAALCVPLSSYSRFYHRDSTEAPAGRRVCRCAGGKATAGWPLHLRVTLLTSFPPPSAIYVPHATPPSRLSPLSPPPSSALSPHPAHHTMHYTTTVTNSSSGRVVCCGRDLVCLPWVIWRLSEFRSDPPCFLFPYSKRGT